MKAAEEKGKFTRPLPSVPAIILTRPHGQFESREDRDKENFPPPCEHFPGFQKWLPSLHETHQRLTMEVPAHAVVWIELLSHCGGDIDLLPEAVGGILQDWYLHQRKSHPDSYPWEH